MSTVLSVYLFAFCRVLWNEILSYNSLLFWSILVIHIWHGTYHKHVKHKHNHYVTLFFFRTVIVFVGLDALENGFTCVTRGSCSKVFVDLFGFLFHRTCFDQMLISCLTACCRNLLLSPLQFSHRRLLRLHCWQSQCQCWLPFACARRILSRVMYLRWCWRQQRNHLSNCVAMPLLQKERFDDTMHICMLPVLLA